MAHHGDASFVGRGQELEALATALAHARAGRAGVVLIEGEPGVGKTALLKQFMASATDLQLLVVCGDEAETELPYGLVDQLVRCCAGAGQGSLASLEADPATDPLRVGVQLLDLLGQLQAAHPVALVVDDAQWADPLSLRAITFALRRLFSDTVLGVVAVRTAEVARLPSGLLRLVASERGTRLALGGLTTEEVRQLADAVGLGRLPHRAAERLRAHTAGLPLHVRALFDELPARTLHRPDPDLPAPRSFASLVRVHLAGCSPDAAALVQAASVLGARCRLAQAAALARLEDPVTALDEAVRQQLLVEEDVENQPGIAFPHPLVQAATYAGLGPAGRTRLHDKAAGLFTGELALGHRVRASTGPDETLASDLERAGRAHTSRRTPLTAGRLLLQAARLCPPGAHADRLLCDAVKSLLAAGDVASAAATAEQLSTLPPTAYRSHLLGRLALFAGRQDEAAQLLTASWEESCGGRESDDLRAETATLLAQLMLIQCRASEAVSWSQRALTVAGDGQPLRGYAKSVLAAGLGISGRPREGLAVLAALPDSAELPADELDALTGRGLLRLWTDDLVGARADLAAVVDAGRTGEPPASYVQALGYLAETHYRMGAWQDATVAVERAVALCEDFDQAWLGAFVYALAAYLQTGRGDWSGAQAHARLASAAAARLGDGASVAYAATARAELAFARGDHPAVLAAVAPLVEMGDQDGVFEPGVFRWRELYADSLMRLGVGEEEDVLVSLETAASARALHSSSAGAARVRGCLEARRGATDLASAAFEVALSHLTGLTMPYLSAHVLFDYGQFLRRTGRRRAAAVQLGAAAELLRSLGAHRALERCVEELVACGLHRSHRSARPVQLTPRELAVARLVTAGRSNREVAAELFVSVKTVEFHLANVFVKRGVSSRRELAARTDASPVAD